MTPAKITSARDGSEFDLQKTVVALLRFNAKPDVIWYHVPNGEYRSKRTAARLKASGVRPGVADIAVVVGGGFARFLELKTRKGRQSVEQKAFQLSCERNGALYRIARTPEEAAAILFGWGALKTNPLAGRVHLTAARAA
jgi:hypothetical protein